MARLAELTAREVLDSRGRPTVEVEARASDGAVGVAIVPSGASTGRHEAVELRDRDPAKYGGLGVRRAVANVMGEIARGVVGFELEDQGGLDGRLIELDGTPRKERLGANAILGVSLAAAHAAAASAGVRLYEHIHRLWRSVAGDAAADRAGMRLPLPMVNMISGGLHAGGGVDFQDFLMVPVGARSYGEALDWAAGVYRALGRVLRSWREEGTLVGDEGGYGPRLEFNVRGVERLTEAIEAAGLEPGREVGIALDAAATQLYDPVRKTYVLKSEGDRELSGEEMIGLLESWCGTYPIVSIEDGLAEDDWEGWRELTRRLGGRVQLVGDDLFCTQVARIERGVKEGASNAVLIKMNQVGTLSETLEALALARRNGYRAVVSARSGETEDWTMADLAVGTGAGQIKIGSVARSERLAKYNRLLRIEEWMGGAATAPFASGELTLREK
jgi:enolase